MFGELGEQWVAHGRRRDERPEDRHAGRQSLRLFRHRGIDGFDRRQHGWTRRPKGLQINVILKSGGDQFHGNGAFFGTNHHLEFDNVNDELRARGVTGGNPVKLALGCERRAGRTDRPQQALVLLLGAPPPARTCRRSTPSTTTASRRRCPTCSSSFHTGKLSYQMNPSNKFIGFVQYVRQGGEATNNQFSSCDSRIYSPTQATTSKIEWQGIRGNKFVSLQSGAWIWNVSRQCYSNNVATTDLLTSRITGCNNNYGINSFEGRNHTHWDG